MSLETEFNDDAPDEMDEFFAVDLTLIDDDGTEIIGRAIVADMQVSRELNARGNFSQVRSAPVVLMRASNPEILIYLGGIGVIAIPDGMSCEIEGQLYRTSAATQDEVSLSFEIQQTIT